MAQTTLHWTARAAVVGIAILAAATQNARSEEPGVFADRVVIGQSAAFEGAAGQRGRQLRLGLMLAFDEANRNGGVNGRRIDLISQDDGALPAKAAENADRLIGSARVFALIGAVGAPTSKAMQPIATRQDVPLIGASTGAAFLRDPALRNVINVRSSFDQETDGVVRHLADVRGFTRIAVLYEDGSFGRAMSGRIEKALRERGLESVAVEHFASGTTAVRGALLSIRKSDPEAVVMVGAPKPIATFVKAARKLAMGAEFVSVGVSDPVALADGLGPAGAGVVVAGAVPSHQDLSIELVRRFHAVLGAYAAKAEPTPAALEGYLVGRLFVMALERAGSNPTRGSLLDAFNGGGAFDLGGLSLTYGAGDNQGLERVFLTVIEHDGGFRSLPGAGPDHARSGLDIGARQTAGR